MGYLYRPRTQTGNTPCIYPGQQPAIPQQLIDEMLKAVAQTIDAPLLFDARAPCIAEFSMPELPPDLPVLAHLFDIFDLQWDYINITAPLSRPPMTLSTIIASRLQFTINVLKEIPKIMVQENQTLWSHKQLYTNGMPKNIQAVTNIQTLLISPVPTTPLEILSHIYILLLSQIMVFFSLDLTANISLILYLESSALILLSCIFFPDPSYTLITLLPTPDIQIVFFVFYFIQLHRLIQGEKNLVYDQKLGLDAGELAAAWTENDYFIVGELNFARVLTEAGATDVDIFGRILLVSYLGIKKARA
ncbi:hypothetical protein BDV26DRAFT_281933 [Aspergillus bertholletiae]|uniref:Uncharacterized protein n=1 Tax=Aspergillus bertholletiae TaxID=1226010 RepID=A0A5N7B6R3_9EURO|nr:hypothetical protein BDV26DRAFT_281933 [Aspergillus bertholletiae]